MGCCQCNALDLNAYTPLLNANNVPRADTAPSTHQSVHVYDPTSRFTLAVHGYIRKHCPVLLSLDTITQIILFAEESLTWRFDIDELLQCAKDRMIRSREQTIRYKHIQLSFICVLWRKSDDKRTLFLDVANNIRANALESFSLYLDVSCAAANAYNKFCIYDIDCNKYRKRRYYTTVPVYIIPSKYFERETLSKISTFSVTFKIEILKTVQHQEKANETLIWHKKINICRQLIKYNAWKIDKQWLERMRSAGLNQTFYSPLIKEVWCLQSTPCNHNGDWVLYLRLLYLPRFIHSIDVSYGYDASTLFRTCKSSSVATFKAEATEPCSGCQVIGSQNSLWTESNLNIRLNLEIRNVFAYRSNGSDKIAVPRGEWHRYGIQ